MFDMYDKTDFDKGFYGLFREIIEDKLNDFEGQSLTGYQLMRAITYEDDIEGGLFFYQADAKVFIHDNWAEAFETYDRWIEETGESINPCKNPCGFSYFMERYGITELLRYCPTFARHWEYDPITITPETINKLKRELIAAQHMKEQEQKNRVGCNYTNVRR